MSYYQRGRNIQQRNNQERGDFCFFCFLCIVYRDSSRWRCDADALALKTMAVLRCCRVELDCEEGRWVEGVEREGGGGEGGNR